jgi:hypothetical protein
VNSDLATRIAREEGVRNYLFAYEKSEKIFKQNEDVLLSPDCSVMVDSGAYVLWAEGRGEKVNRQEYGEFCQRLKAWARCQITFVNADVIPGRPSKKNKRKEKPGICSVSAREREESARESWDNYLFLRREMGLNVMPVFHQFESLDWLRKMASETSFIGISPSNIKGFPPDRKRRWLEDVFGILGPHFRTHAFGCTAPRLLMDFRSFYSADSTTWMNSQKFAALTMFDEKTFTMSHRRSDESEEFRVRCNVQQFLRLEREFDYVWYSDHPENIVKYIKEVVMKTGRKGSTDVELNARKLLRLKEAELKIFLAYCVKSTTQDERAPLSLRELEELTGMQKDALTSGRASLKRQGWLVRLKRTPSGSYVPHPDQTKSESGGHADWHCPQIP